MGHFLIVFFLRRRSIAGYVTDKQGKKRQKDKLTNIN